MSYFIEYDKKVIRTTRGYIFMTLGGDNNLTTSKWAGPKRKWIEVAVRSWNGPIERILEASETEIMDYCHDVYDQYPDYEAFKCRGKWIYHKDMERYFKNGMTHAQPLEDNSVPDEIRNQVSEKKAAHIQLGLYVANCLEREGHSLQGIPGFFKFGSHWCLTYSPGILIPTRNIQGQIVIWQVRRKYEPKYLTLSCGSLPGAVTDTVSRCHFPLGNSPLSDIIHDFFRGAGYPGNGQVIYDCHIDMPLEFLISDDMEKHRPLRLQASLLQKLSGGGCGRCFPAFYTSGWELPKASASCFTQ